MTTITVLEGDITAVVADAIVNAANSSLMGGGGVDGAIHAAGGPAIREACRRLVAEHGQLPTGQAVITTGGKLPARHVIHTVGPIYRNHTPADAARLLADCYRSSLEVAAAHGCRTVAFPNISTGVYGYPKEEAARVATDVVTAWIGDHPETLDEVTFVCFDGENRAIYARLLSG